MFEITRIAVLWLSRQLWLSIPLFVTIIAMVISMTPANLFRGLVPEPNLVLVSVFFWAIYGPAFLPPWAVFVLGLIQDLATGGLIGFWALIYPIAYGFTLSQRVFFSGRSGPGVWIGFAMVAGLTGVVSLILGSISFGRWLPPGPVIMQTAVTILVYPIAARLLMAIRRRLTTAREAI